MRLSNKHFFYNQIFLPKLFFNLLHLKKRFGNEKNAKTHLFQASDVDLIFIFKCKGFFQSSGLD